MVVIVGCLSFFIVDLSEVKVDLCVVMVLAVHSDALCELCGD